MATILVVDDELGIRALLSEILSDEGHVVELAENAAQARAFRERQCPDLVLLDIWMPDVDGVTLLKEWGSSGLLTMPVLMMSGHGTIDTAVEATKFGAQAFLEKPITLNKLLKSVEGALVKPTASAPAAAPASASGGISFTRIQGEQRISYSSAPSAYPSSAYSNGAVSAAPVTLLPASQQNFDLDRPLREARDAFEKAYFEFHLVQEHGSMTRVAEKTGLERTHLYRKLKQLGVDLNKNRRAGL